MAAGELVCDLLLAVGGGDLCAAELALGVRDGGGNVAVDDGEGLLELGALGALGPLEGAGGGEVDDGEEDADRGAAEACTVPRACPCERGLEGRGRVRVWGRGEEIGGPGGGSRGRGGRRGGVV